MSATYLIADPHFFHASPDRPDGIIRMCSRPFANGAEMNATMAANWRAVVRPNDDVFVVGDFAHRADPDELRKLFDFLPGRKHLIIGNHDDGLATRALPWESIRDVAYVSIESTFCTLAHFAWRTWPRIRRGGLMLYGHSHGRLPGNNQSCDIGVDVLGFVPVRLNQIKAHLATLPPLIDPEGADDLGADPPKPK